MKFNLPALDKCCCCGCDISDEHKKLLNESTFSQTWCMICLVKWLESEPDDAHKNDTRWFLRKKGIKV